MNSKLNTGNIMVKTEDNNMMGEQSMTTSYKKMRTN
jgi:hypothetical protein